MESMEPRISFQIEVYEGSLMPKQIRGSITWKNEACEGENGIVAGNTPRFTNFVRRYVKDEISILPVSEHLRLTKQRAIELLT